MPTAINNWNNADQFDTLRDIVNEVIDLGNDEIVDALAKFASKSIVEMLTRYQTGVNSVYILWGIEFTGTNPGARTWTEGAIYYEGEIYLVEAGGVSTTGSNVLVWDDITAAGVHEQKTATLVNGTVGSGIAQNAEDTNTTRQTGKFINTVSDNALSCTVIPITNWNMDSDITKSIAHGFADISKIVSIKVLIYNDGITNIYPIEFSDPSDNTNTRSAGRVSIDATNIVLTRMSSGFFDSGSFNGTGDRGKITIIYES